MFNQPTPCLCRLPILGQTLTRLLLLLALFFSVPASTALAQFELPGGFGNTFGVEAKEKITLNARITAPTTERPTLLVITADLAAGWHTFSITQPKGGPSRTKIKVTPSNAFKLVGDFSTTPKPHTYIDKEFFVGVEIQEHTGQVTWYVPLQLPAGVDLSKLSISGKLKGQTCKVSCIPHSLEFTARLGKLGNIKLPKIPLVAAFPKAVAPVTPQQTVEIEKTKTPAPLVRLTGKTTLGKFKNKGSEVLLTGRLIPATVKPGEAALLQITATPNPNWHIYAYQTQDKGIGTKPTLIGIEKRSVLSFGEATADLTPQQEDQSDIGFGIVSYHEKPVTWTLPIRVQKNTATGVYQIVGMIGYQTCSGGKNGSCNMPEAARFLVNLNIAAESNPTSEAKLTFAPEKYSAVKRFVLGKNSMVTQTELLPVKKTSAETPGKIPPTTNSSNAVIPKANNPKTQSNSSALFKNKTDKVALGSSLYDLSKLIPSSLSVDNSPETDSSDIADPNALEPNTTAESKQTDEADGQSFLAVIAAAFVGGIILNFMPCVLPVIGLKIMSFSNQAGKSKTEAFKLNAWYSLGIMAVFWALGLAAVGLGMGWGDQFQDARFTIPMVAMVFAMALSMLGVWEIPIPGFMGTGKTQDLANKEGVAGAFLKGCITTILATPCTGPFMATALGWAVKQPPQVTLTVFTSLGLGMASPYLAIGLFPALIKFLPKPGMWMETFKHAMGFVLLGTAAWLMFGMRLDYYLPVMVLMIGIGFACWMFNKTPAYAPLKDRLQMGAFSLLILGVTAIFSFGYLHPEAMMPKLERQIALRMSHRHEELVKEIIALTKSEIEDDEFNAVRMLGLRTQLIQKVLGDELAPWSPFNLAKLQRILINQDRTVMIDFTADWCLSCKTFEKTVLHTQTMDALIKKHSIITMVGDKSVEVPEVEAMLSALGAGGVPVIAVFPAGDPYHPIVFQGGYTTAQLQNAFEKATKLTQAAATKVGAKITPVSR